MGITIIPFISFLLYIKEGYITKRAYPTFIAKYEADFLVYVPDMEIYTEGKGMTDAIEMARDAIGLKGIDLEDDGKELPEASDYRSAWEKAKAEAEDFDYTTGILTMVDVDFSAYRKKMDNKMVRRNVTLPNWLNLEAERLQLNVSKVLQEALAERVSQMR